MSIRSLLDELSSANKAYRLGKPTLTDALYDQKEDELVALLDLCEEEDTDPDVVEARAFLASIGAPPEEDTKWVKVTHGSKMTSLNKAKDWAEFQAWHSSCGTINEVVVSDKCDGISLSMRYVEGKLTLAATRGDGDTGEDITRNVLKMKGVQPFIRGLTGYIRGEIVLLKTDWQKQFPSYSNPRNAAAGIAKREDGEGSEHLTVLHYQLIRDGSVIPKKSIEFKALEKLGCPVPMWFSATDKSTVLDIYNSYINGSRARLDYDVDGLVIEVDDIALRDNLGELNKRPKGAVALKFPPDAKETILRNVRWQIGKSGRVTPVAEFDAVDLAGVTVKQASIHNLANIQKLTSAVGQQYLFIGDTIVVSRRGDVIPYVEEVLQTDLPDDATALTPPTLCPECNTSLVMEGEYLMCCGEDCPAQVLGGVSRWVKKIGVLGVGDSIIAALIDHAGVTDPADLYLLDPAKIEGIPTGTDGSRLGRTAYIMMDELKSKSEIPLHIFVGSLGIPLCARSMCKSLVDAGFDTLEKMEAATVGKIAAIPGMGDVKASAFVNGFKAKRTLMDKLLDNGVTIKGKSVGVMTGKSVCFTGVRSPDLEKSIEDAGGTIKSSVGAGLTFLVQKDVSSQSSKSQKAKSLGVTVVDVEGMWALLGKGSSKATPVPVSAPIKKVSVPQPASDIFSLFGDD